MALTKKKSKRRSGRVGFETIKNGILSLPGEEYRLIIETSSINIELKGEEEKKELTESFKSFLKSLSFSIQIFMGTKEFNPERYLKNFPTQEEIGKEIHYAELRDDYCRLVRRLVAVKKVSSRHFYIVIPYRSKTKDFKNIERQLSLYRDLILEGLGRLGMGARVLSKPEVVNLNHDIYNPIK